MASTNKAIWQKLNAKCLTKTTIVNKILNPPSIQTVLTNLISLTNERDVYQLELLLAQSLYDLIQPLNSSAEKSVVVYRAVNVNKRQFTPVVIGKAKPESLINPSLEDSLADCFNSGEFISIQSDNDSEINLYPLKNTANRTVAVIAVQATINDAQLHETITMLLQIHQNFAGLINDNEHDTLTGLLNRKTFDSKLEKVLEQKRKSTKRVDDQADAAHFLALFDIDHFKRINDEHGHLIGDDVLKTLSGLFKSTFRDKDLLFRYGGEEFVGVFECNNKKDIKHLLERFRKKVSQHQFNDVGQVTISIGFTEIDGFDDADQILDRADQALYYAKDNGRNCIYQYENLVQAEMKQKAASETSLAATSG